MSAEKINTFIVYSSKDKETKERLLDHLNPFTEEYDLAIWHDELISPGDDWNAEIQQRFEKTDIFLLLVSVDFLNSEYIRQVELKAAIESYRSNKSVIVPAIIGYCQWDTKLYTDDNFTIKDLQVLPPAGKPLDEWTTRDKGFNEIAIGVRKVIKSIRDKRSAISHTEKSIDDKVYTKVEVEAGFPGGEDAWRNYLKNNLKADVPANLGADNGKYTIVVKFAIDQNGFVYNVEAEDNPGYGISEEVIRVIKNSPRWNPAIQNGKNVNAYRRQPVTFLIED